VHENGPHPPLPGAGADEQALHCGISRQGLLTRARDGEDPAVH
jgi:hypothetical protein